jgi:hypothetical protein
LQGDKHKSSIDDNLKEMKYPSEFPRARRSFTELSHFKASDYKNLIFYLAVPGLREILHDDGYRHLLVYVVFIRLLTQEVISNRDIEDADILFKFFHQQFETLHGLHAMTYKLHAHSHFINQVLHYGPLHKISCFPFEGNVYFFI